MSGFEFNKIFAAVLVAGIVAMFGGFLADFAVAPKSLAQDAVAIEGGEETAGGTAAEAPKGPEPILGLIAAADVAKGEKVAKACAACHAFEKGGPVKTGPALYGVVGRAKAADAAFAYSDAMKTHGGDWSYSELNHFLWKPKAFIAGTKMNFVGIKKPEDRAALIAWLRTLADAPAALPSEGDIAKEAAELAPPAPAAAEGEAASEAAPAAAH